MIATQFSEFRKHAKEFLDRVEDGESIQILRHGKPVAVISPVNGAPSRWKTAPSRIHLKGASASETLLHERRLAAR